MSIVKTGDTIQVHYTGTLDDGSVFDSSRDEGREPIQFQIGSGQLIPGFENGVVGMSVGDSKKLLSRLKMHTVPTLKIYVLLYQLTGYRKA